VYSDVVRMRTKAARECQKLSDSCHILMHDFQLSYTIFTWTKLKAMNQFGGGGKIPLIPNLSKYVSGWSASCFGHFIPWERAPGTCREKNTWSAVTF
jgi:hypothetical protein